MEGERDNVWLEADQNMKKEKLVAALDKDMLHSVLRETGGSP